METLALFIMLLVIIPMTLYVSIPSKKQVLSAKTTSISPTQSITPTPSVVKNLAIEKAIESVLATRKGEYGIYYKNLKTGQVYEKNSHTIFTSASLYKLWVMGELFRQIDKGDLKKEEVLIQSAAALNNEFGIGSGSAELTDGIVRFSVEDALENMITVSDNYSALLLSHRLRLANIGKFLQVNGFSDSSLGVPPKTSPADIGSYFERLIQGNLIGPVYSKEMVAILKRQQLNDRIPKYLPKEIEIAHKTGELDGYKHDAGVVFDPRGTYILVVLSKSDSESYAAETIAMISREVYQAQSQ